MSTANFEDDEPTVIGHRPVPLARPSVVRPGSGGAGAGTPPAMPPAAPAHVAPPFAGKPAPPAKLAPASATSGLSLADIPVPSSTGRPEDVIAAAATPLLALVTQLRQSVDYADVGALRVETVAQIKAFDERAISLGAPVADVGAARYVLCSLLDETVMTTPWGAASDWSTHSLLNQFHGETWGGEKVFTILDRVRGNPQQHLALLKLVDLALAFGFEGKYRIMEGGQYQLEALRDEMGRIWRSHVKAPPNELSLQWQGVAVQRKLRSALPLWIVFAVTGAILLALYAMFAYRLDQSLTPIEQRLERIGAPLS
ncbi:type IVB secretion system protein IcmH/DotU [Xanthobacteraceae bacterium A53D]